MKKVFICFLFFSLFFFHSVLAQESKNNEVGRYQIFFSPHARADAYLLDTVTGKVWSSIRYTDVEDYPTLWKYQERVDSRQEFIDWIMKQKIIEKME